MVNLLEEVEIAEVAIPVEYTEVWDLKLSRHNMFSLEADQSKQTTPVAFLLNCINDIKETDIVKISICAEPYNRLKWEQFVDK